MKKTLLLYLMILLFCFIDYANIGYCGKSVEETDSVNLKKMEELAFWFIETGLGQYYERKGKNAYKLRPGDEKWLVNYPDAVWISDYIEERGYSHGLPEVEKNGKIAKIIIGYDRYRLMNVAECFLRTEYKKKLYEYWVVKEWKTGLLYRKATFIIANTTALNDKRTIMHTSDQFVEKYEIDKEFSVVFPSDDYKVLYGLQAWDYPENYKNSKLKDFRINHPAKGVYEPIPWPPK